VISAWIPFVSRRRSAGPNEKVRRSPGSTSPFGQQLREYFILIMIARSSSSSSSSGGQQQLPLFLF
jgi:hypothetical protein